MEKAVTAFTVLKSLISGGFSEGNDDQDSGLSTPRTDVRGLVVMPIGMAVGHSMVWRALNKVYFCRQLLDTQTSVVARLHA